MRGRELILGLIAGLAAGALIFRGGGREVPAAGPKPLWLVPDEVSADGGGLEEERGERIELPSSVLTVSVDGEPVEMELEEYLFGVVAGEMSASSEPEALKAQAVAARTFTALHMAGRAKCRSGCTVCDDPFCCQAYMKSEELKKAWGSKYEENAGRIRAAVSGTSGVVAVYEGELISALYHASSGPATESSEEVFAVAMPYLVSVDSPEGDAGSVSAQYFEARELVEKLNAAFPEAKLSLPLGEGAIRIVSRTESGRVQKAAVGGAEVTGGMLRAALGLKSTAFTLALDAQGAEFTCLGYGHGVGMSQCGANEMAKNGSDYKEILAHYYTGTELAGLSFGRPPAN